MMRIFALLLILAAIAGAQVYPYRDCAFPAWGGDTVRVGRSLYYDVDFEKRLKIKMIRYEPRVGDYVVYVEWVKTLFNLKGD